MAQQYGEAPLIELLAALAPPPCAALQPRDDLWAAVYEQATAHYGDKTAQAAVEEIRSSLMVPTSNHFGVDTFADSVQGTLLFSLRPRPTVPRRPPVVVLGFGAISLNNLTYPMGLRLYDPTGGDLRQLPQRLPVFPNRVRHCVVGAAAPFDGPMVDRAIARLHRMSLTGQVTPFCAKSAERVLEEDFAELDTLALPSYCSQSTRINTRLWRRMFADPDNAAQLVLLQIEPICARLLAADVRTPGSLAHTLFFDPMVRERLLAGLDGARGCWRQGVSQAGTIFFWGVGESGKRVPLTLVAGDSAIRLAGVEQGVRPWDIDFSPSGLAEAMRAGRLMPSLFTCFAVLAFARGLTCVGGYYQVKYLPVMQRAIAAALAASGDHQRAAEIVAQVPTRVCLAGVQGIARVLDDGSVIPAGPVEIAGGDGLSDADLDALRRIPVRDAYLLAFTELFHHLVPDAQLPENWIHLLASENGEYRPTLVRVR